MKENHYDVLIIGAGILGCFAARELRRRELSVAVLEKNADVCTEISKASTGIIYPGYDQHPGSVKAALCVKSAKAFPALARELDVPYRKTGLLMLSFGERADAVLGKKLEQAKKNGVEGVRILSPEEVYAMEPELCGGIRGALFSENTCVVDPWKLGIAAYENARSNGASFFFGQEVIRMSRTEGGFSVETPDRIRTAERVLVCAGLYGDRVWEMLSRPQVRLIPQGADYIVMDTDVGGLIRHVISVEPEQKGEGLTLVPTVDGNILLGPTRREVTKEARHETSADGLRELKQKCRQLIPSMPMDRVIRSFAGARPNPFLTDENGNLMEKSLNDFVILEEDGFFDMIGVKTPGITCASELGALMADRIVRSYEKEPPLNESFEPVRKGIRRTLTEEKRTGEDDGEIICRCRQITRAEAREAIRRGALTLDGIKRRTGAGMGRCQGGYCMEKLLHLLSGETGQDPYAVTKDGPGSELIEYR